MSSLRRAVPFSVLSLALFVSVPRLAAADTIVVAASEARKATAAAISIGWAKRPSGTPAR